MVSMRIEGGKELAAALNSLSARVRRNTLVTVLTEAAEPMRKRAESLAPHEPGPPDIKANIIVARNMKTIGESGFLERQDEFQGTVAMGPAKGFFYGLFQEYGTTGKRGHAAQPFMRPAFDSEAPRALKNIGEALWLELAAKRISRPTIEAPSVPTGPGSGLT